MTLAIATVNSATAAAAPNQKQADGALRKAAQEFEAILLREMLKYVEKCGKLGTGGDDSGQNIYGSMVVDAVAGAVAQAGGLGLTKVITSAWQSAERDAPEPPPRETRGARGP
jgi:Rod binding domain-containing protein